MKKLDLLLITAFAATYFSCKKEESSDIVLTNDCSSENNNVSKKVPCSVQLNISSVFTEKSLNDKRIFTVNNIPTHLVGEYPNK